jgi:predicted transporter
MFMRMIDDIKESTGVAVRMTSLAAAIALAFVVTIAFLCAAAFVYVLQNYGPIEACLTGAGIFFVIALIGIGVYTARKRQARQEAKETAKETAKSALHTALADPVMMATALQIVRAIGIKKLVPILAVGGLALGLLASRPSSHEAPAE